MAKHTTIGSKKWCCVSECYETAYRKVLVLRFRDRRKVFLWLCVEHCREIDPVHLPLFEEMEIK